MQLGTIEFKFKKIVLTLLLLLNNSLLIVISKSRYSIKKYVCNKVHNTLVNMFTEIVVV